MQKEDRGEEKKADFWLSLLRGLFFKKKNDG